MKKLFLKRMVAIFCIALGLTGAVNVMADTVEPRDIEPKSVKSGPKVEAVKSYTYDKYEGSNVQLNKRAYKYVYVPAGSRVSWYEDIQQTWYVSRANRFVRVYHFTGGY